jgi:hypothetical protein
MNRSSRLNERKILDLHYQGYSRLATAEMIGVAPSTVSEVITLLPESLTYLRELSVELRKHNLSVFEAKKGTELRARLDDLGVKFEKLQSFVESAEKMRTNPDYEPKQVIQSAMKLNELEKSGKTYPEALVDFEEKNDSIERLETREHELTEKVETLEIEKKRRLAENNVTEKEIVYVADLRQKFRKHGVGLSDVESLQKYLENMQETGGNPTVFVEYTREHGSLNRRTALLRQEEQAHALNLQSLEEKEELARSALSRSLSMKSELDRQNGEERAKLLAVRREIAEEQQKEVEEFVNLRQLLNVEAEAKKVTEALAVKEARLDKLTGEIGEKQAQIQSLQQRAQELEDKNKNIEREIKVKLGINDYATQQRSGLAKLQSQQLSLEKENNEKRERIALADTTTAFLTNQTPYDFNRFYSYVQMMKTMRDSRTYQTSPHLTIAEEQTRMLALEAFKGLLATTADYSILQHQKQESDKTIARLETKARQLESQLKDTENKLESALKEKQFTEAVRANFEGRATTVAEVKNLIVSMFNEEVERREDEKFNAGAAVTYGALDFIYKKITHRDNKPAKSEE